MARTLRRSRRPANRKENRVDRRLAQNQTGTRRVVVAMRQRKGRTPAFVTKIEADGVELVDKAVASSAEIHADEASRWDILHANGLRTCPKSLKSGSIDPLENWCVCYAMQAFPGGFQRVG
jgi:hypothetical protein